MWGFWTLLKKELLRFLKVSIQTLLAPVLSAFLYLLIFSHVLDRRVEVYGDVAYAAFLVPGLIMMSVLQNAFSNSSSSLIQSKIMGSLFFVLVTPITYIEFLFAYLLAAMIRGLAVGLGVWAVSCVFSVVIPHSWGFMLLFAVLGCALMGTFGVVAGIWAEKFDHLAAFQNFLIMPLTFLSGVFYSIHSLPPVWQTLSKFNPFFYMIDGFRYGFFGTSDVSPWLSLSVVTGAFIIIAILTIKLLQSGYRLRN